MTEGNDAAGRMAELEADNRRLRRLLDQRDAPRELRHRLRSTVALVRAIIRKSVVTPRDLDSYAYHLEGRLDALARAQAEADVRGGSDLHKLISDELLQYGANEGERLSLSGPDLCLQPRAGQVFALAVHELAINSVEHGALGAGGRIAIEWELTSADETPVLTFIWREVTEHSGPAPSHEGFGTEVLTRMLAYELDAATDLTLDAGTFACRISFPFTPDVGMVTGTGG